MKLLPRDTLVKTSAVDHADWNYRPHLRPIIRLRYRLVLDFLGGDRFGRLLEVGYGSGVFLPELAGHCDELYGIDVHPEDAAVAAALARCGCRARLVQASATAIPFPDGFFDAAVAVSSLEFIDDQDAACAEVRRVLRPGGRFIVVTPGHSPVVDWGLRLLTGQSARRDFGDRRSGLAATLGRHFTVRRRRSVPRWAGPVLRLYTAFDLTAAADRPEGSA